MFNLYNICLLRAFEHIHMEFARYKCLLLLLLLLFSAHTPCSYFQEMSLCEGKSVTGKGARVRVRVRVKCYLGVCTFWLLHLYSCHANEAIFRQQLCWNSSILCIGGLRKDFYNLVDQEITDDAKDFNVQPDGPRDDRWYRSCLQPGKGYVNAKYVTLQCKITSVLNPHFISLNYLIS